MGEKDAKNVAPMNFGEGGVYDVPSADMTRVWLANRKKGAEETPVAEGHPHASFSWMGGEDE